MSQELTDVIGNQLFSDTQEDQAVPFMTQTTVIEVPIEREKGWPVQLMQQSDYFVIFHPLPADLVANLLDGNTPAPEQAALAVGHVLIEDVHASSDS